MFRDICKKDFLDSYQNLTLKTMMGLRWVDSFCNQTKFVLKIDSDTIPNLQNLVQHSETLLHDTILEGHLMKGHFPVRDNSTWPKKWVVSRELYPHPTYPTYVNGPSYLLSGHLVNPAVSVSKHIRYLPIEDAYVGMLMKTIGVKDREMGPLLALVSPCFRENVIVTCKIVSFLCSLDNFLPKNVIVFFFGNQISKWRSFEKKGYFWPIFQFF